MTGLPTTDFDPVIVTSVDLAQAAPSEWAEQYPPGDARVEACPEFGVIREQLLALDPPTYQAVERLTGNASWTNATCFRCGKYSRTVVRFPGVWDDGEDTIDICPVCLAEAVTLLETRAGRKVSTLTRENVV